MPLIHPTAFVDATAELAPDVELGPYSLVGPRVKIGAGTRLHAFAQIVQDTVMGEGNVVHSHAVIGGDPQDKKYKGEPTRLVIGSGNTFRESVTINRGTIQDQSLTQVGDDNWVMAYVHIAHDVRLGSHTILANGVQLAGHVTVGDHAIIGGLTGVHQFVRVGAHAMAGAGTTLVQDLPPYVMCNGSPCTPHGMNTEGLKRRGFSDEQVRGLRAAYKTLYKSGLTLADAIAQLEGQADAQPALKTTLQPLIDFLKTPGRGIVR